MNLNQEYLKTILFILVDLMFIHIDPTDIGYLTTKNDHQSTRSTKKGKKMMEENPEITGPSTTDTYGQAGREFTPIFLEYCGKWTFLGDSGGDGGYLNWNDFGCIQDIEEGLRYEYENFPISALDEYQYFSSVIDGLVKLDGFSDFVKQSLSRVKLEELRKIKTTRLNKSNPVIQKPTAGGPQVFVHGDEFKETETEELKPRRIVNVKKRFGAKNYQQAPPPEPVPQIPKTKDALKAEKLARDLDRHNE